MSRSMYAAHTSAVGCHRRRRYYYQKSNFSFDVIYARAKSQSVHGSTLNTHWQSICAKSFEYYINYTYQKLATHHCQSHHHHWRRCRCRRRLVIVVIMNASRKTQHTTRREKNSNTLIVGNLLAHKLSINFWFN